MEVAWEQFNKYGEIVVKTKLFIKEEDARKFLEKKTQADNFYRLLAVR